MNEWMKTLVYQIEIWLVFITFYDKKRQLQNINDCFQLEKVPCSEDWLAGIQPTLIVLASSVSASHSVGVVLPWRPSLDKIWRVKGDQNDNVSTVSIHLFRLWTFHLDSHALCSWESVLRQTRTGEDKKCSTNNFPDSRTRKNRFPWKIFFSVKFVLCSIVAVTL